MVDFLRHRLMRCLYMSRVSLVSTAEHKTRVNVTFFFRSGLKAFFRAIMGTVREQMQLFEVPPKLGS